MFSSTHPRRPRRTRLAVGVGIGLSAALTATLVSSPPAPAALAAGTAAPTSPERPSVDRQAREELPYQDPSLPTARRVADLLGRMTLAEKVGQMTQAERIDIDADPSLIAEYHLGSVLSGGGSVPSPNTPRAWADMVDTYQRAALGDRLGIPLLYGVDAVHGHANLLGATVFPHNIGLGATRDPALLRRIGAITAEETRATGPNWAFAPCVCVARDDRWGRTYEAYGESPQLVARLETIIDGLQGRRGELDNPDRVLASAKHFAGDGLTDWDTGEGAYTLDQGISRVSRGEFARLALSPYRPAVREHRVGSIMPSFSSVDWTEDGIGNPIKMSANKQLLTGWLKERMGFEGILISDWRAIHQIPGTLREQVKASVNAGMDMFMEPYSGEAVGWREFIATLIELVEAGEVPGARIDDAVTRILTAKFELGLFEQALTPRQNLDEVGSEAHRAVARRAVAQSQVLLVNRSRTLPLEPRARGAAATPVYVAGSNADNIGNQAGGWTLTWQGGSTNVIPGDTVLDAVRDATDRRVVFSEDAARAVPRGADGVVVVGETPYTEGFGDVGGPQWGFDPGDEGVLRPQQTMQLTVADRRAIQTVCARAATCTVLVVSGRPMILPPAIVQQSDALVASWLPGSEGAGVADVLFGRRSFTGRLPLTWPRTLEQEPINVGDAEYDPLFAFGHGLRTRTR